MIMRLIHLKAKTALGLYAFLDVMCVGFGMGVPFFNILFGFPVGWYLVMRLEGGTAEVLQVLRKVLQYAVITSGFTMVLMMILWLPLGRVLFEPGYDYENTGVPMILFEPMASFIGWLVLMVFVSPFLQLLATIFSAYVTLLVRLAGEPAAGAGAD